MPFRCPDITTDCLAQFITDRMAEQCPIVDSERSPKHSTDYYPIWTAFDTTNERAFWTSNQSTLSPTCFQSKSIPSISSVSTTVLRALCDSF
jgi:hypothetical protein